MTGEALIQELRKRNADRQRATNGYLHPRRRVQPVTVKDLQVLERALGFKLPDLLRSVYTTVGNGGFGPAYGIVGATQGSGVKKDSLRSCYQEMLWLEEQNAFWRWPRRLLPLAHYGCGMWASVDCEYKTLPMILWDPNNLAEELAGAEARLNWGNAFWDQRLSLRTWLEGWLQDKPEPEPVWPRDAWMKRRLGFVLSK
jgi:hypothetical protein